MRHTAASLLLSEGLPLRTVSEMLGHSDPMTTIRCYAHSMPGSGQVAADAMDRVLGQRR